MSTSRIGEARRRADSREHQAVQSIAKSVLAELGPTLVPDDSERTIAARATAMLSSRGITDTWYYECPALVLLGSRSGLSVSGREYVPGEVAVGLTNLVTVDLSPTRNGFWGGRARSFFIEDGTSTARPSSPAFVRGARVQRALHGAMQGFVSRRTSFEELFLFANGEIERFGFENLDARGNVGHSIEASRADRRFIERGNTQALGDLGLFAFEPHVRERGSAWGFKHKDIYAFTEDGRPVEISRHTARPRSVDRENG